MGASGKGGILKAIYIHCTKITSKFSSTKKKKKRSLLVCHVVDQTITCFGRVLNQTEQENVPNAHDFLL